MSANNGVYVLRTYTNWTIPDEKGMKQKGERRPVYRVAHVNAIENLNWFERNETINVGAYLKDTWGASKVFNDNQEALRHAYRVAADIGHLEYGVVVLNTDYTFYGD